MPSSISPPISKHRRHHSSFSPEDTSRSSSLIWAEDYYSEDQDRFEDILTAPPPATLTERSFPKSIPVSVDEEPQRPRQNRTHQRSLTALLPSLRSPQRSPQRSPERSPNKERSDFDFMPTLTGDKDGQIKIGEKPKGLSGWFSGSSTPVPLGLPSTSELEDMTMSPSRSPTERDPVKLHKRSQTQGSIPSPTTLERAPTSSRFNFFGKCSTPKTVQIPAAMTDNLLTLDIHAALFPAGDSETFSPAAFKNLQQIAEGLLSHMQEAYKSRTLEFHELHSEQAVQADELEEANTRADHLKMQLEDMARQVTDQDDEIRELKAELKRERDAREEERIARERSIELVKYHRHIPRSDCSDIEEQLHTPTRSEHRRWRKSDSSFDCSEDDTRSESESVFSRSMSPTLTDNSSVLGIHTDMDGDMESPSPSIMSLRQAKIVTMRTAGVDPRAIKSNPLQRPKIVKQRSTFEKILRGNSGGDNEVSDRYMENDLGLADEGCANCRGGEASVAWDTVGLLKVENRGLKERVQELDKAVESALDVCVGLGIRM